MPTLFKPSIPNEEIQALRLTRQQYIDENNRIIKALWEINRKLGKQDTEQVELLKKKESLLQEIAQQNYQLKITTISDEIKTKEIALYGHSNIGSHSPSA